MDRMITVIDLATGEVSDRRSTTPTLDVPPDFERSTGTVALDQKSHGRYVATDGKEREYSAFPRPLSWRVRGEECLIAENRKRHTPVSAGVYRLTVIEWE
jgi:hypothetical protein